MSWYNGGMTPQLKGIHIPTIAESNKVLEERRRRIAACEHEPINWRTTTFRDGRSMVSASYANPKTGEVQVYCAKRCGGMVTVACITRFGARRKAKNCDRNGRTGLATQWYTYAEELGL